MGGRVNRVFVCAALLPLAACATAGDGASVDAGMLAPDAPERSDAASPSDATTEPIDAGDDATSSVIDVTVTPLDPDASDFGTESFDAGAAGDADAGTVGDAQAPADASVDGSADGGDAGPTDAGPIGDGGAADAATEAGVDAGACGGCATGFICGASHYCQTATGVPAFGRVFVIVLDDQPLGAIKGSASAPYLNQLMSTYAYATDYTSDVHPSLPNYFELTSGNPQADLCDCLPGATHTCNANNCTLFPTTCACPQGVSHLGDELDVASIPWREYAESMGAPCNPAGVDGGNLFAANHVPFLYYDDVSNNAGRCQQRVRDFADFAGDLAGTSGVTIRFSLVSPNLCNDMHSNCSGDPVKQGDLWLAAQVPLLLATPGFAPGGRDVLFIVGDELPAALGSGPMPFVVVSPLAKAGLPTAGTYNHYSLLATIEDGLGLARLGNAEASATIADVWR
jgi:phosphatidylinositol-3-phosphatase